MHTGIVLVTVAEDADEAVDNIHNFNEHNANWSDWNEHGGRWRSEVEGAVLRYTDNPELFMETINKFQEYTDGAKKRLIDELGNLTIKELATDPKYSWSSYKNMNIGGKSFQELPKEERSRILDDSLAVWRASRLLEMLNGSFQSETHFYDTTEYTVKSDYLLERIKENPENQFLVVWDYHH